MGVLYSLEGNPFIIRFKTYTIYVLIKSYLSLEGNPFIIRFKTDIIVEGIFHTDGSLEGNPFIIRFKTLIKCSLYSPVTTV